MESTCGNITASYRLPAEAKESYSKAVLQLGTEIEGYWDFWTFDIFLHISDIDINICDQHIAFICFWFHGELRTWLQGLLARQPASRPTATKLAAEVERYRLLGEAPCRAVGDVMTV